jgi:hypothetical protein
MGTDNSEPQPHSLREMADKLIVARIPVLDKEPPALSAMPSV